MTKKSLIDQLKTEGKHFVPDIKDTILSNIPRQEKVHKHILIWQPKLAMALMLLIMITFGISLLPKSESYPTFVTLNINPSVEFSLDENNQVTSYRALNLDGAVLIESYDLVGSDINQALDTLINKAYELGYATDTSTIEVAAYNQRTSTEEKVNQALKAYFTNRITISEVDQDTLDEAKSLNISPRKLLLIQQILVTHDDYTFDQLVKLDVIALNEIKMAYIANEIDLLKDKVTAYRAGLENKKALLESEVNTYIQTLTADINNLKSLYETDMIAFSLAYQTFSTTYFPDATIPILPAVQYQRVLNLESKLSDYQAYLQAQVSSMYQLWLTKFNAHLVDTHADLDILATLELPNVGIQGLAKLASFVDANIKDQIFIEIADRLNTLLNDMPSDAGHAYKRIVDTLYVEFMLYYESDDVSQTLKDSTYIQTIITTYQNTKEN